MGPQVVGRVVTRGEPTEVRRCKYPSRVHRFFDQPDDQTVIDSLGILIPAERGKPGDAVQSSRSICIHGFAQTSTRCVHSSTKARRDAESVRHPSVRTNSVLIPLLRSSAWTPWSCEISRLIGSVIGRSSARRTCRQPVVNRDQRSLGHRRVQLHRQGPGARLDRPRHVEVGRGTGGHGNQRRLVADSTSHRLRIPAPRASSRDAPFAQLTATSRARGRWCRLMSGRPRWRPPTLDEEHQMSNSAAVETAHLKSLERLPIKTVARLRRR